MRLAEARAARGLSQLTLAARAGVSQATVHRLERRKCRPRPHVARRLAAALGLDPRAVDELRPAVPALTGWRPWLRPPGAAG